jgi:mannose-P-dolichol utilization defect protein 1
MSSVALLSVILLSTLAYAAAAAADDFLYGVIPKRCVNTLFEVSCLKATISKLLGYAIITGACIVKLPQIIAFLRAGSVKGVDRNATYLDLLGYLGVGAYHIVSGSPWSSYGETIIITVQSIVIVLMMWSYDFPGVTHSSIVTAIFTVAASIPFALPREYLAYVQIACTVLTILSRVSQIRSNIAQGGTGQLAFMTLFMNFAGSAARIFTSSQEIKQIEVLASFVVATVLNGSLVAQYIYYNFIVAEKSEAPASNKASKKEQVSAPVSDKAPASGSSKKASAADKAPTSSSSKGPASDKSENAPASGSKSSSKSSARKRAI